MIQRSWQSHRLALIAFVVALGAAVFFGVQTISSTIYWMDPAHQDQPLADWMTPRYVAQSYGLPREVIEDVFFIERGSEPRRIRLHDIAAEHGVTLADLQARVDAAKAAFEATRDQ